MKNTCKLPNFAISLLKLTILYNIINAISKYAVQKNLKDNGEGDSKPDEERDVCQDKREEALANLEEDEGGTTNHWVNRDDREAVEPQQQSTHTSKLNR
jgi:hypothetical protein